MEAFSDTRHDRQLLLRVSHGKFFLFNQNRQSRDLKRNLTGLSYLGAGARVKILNDHLTLTGTVGPQLTYEKRQFDRVVSFTNALLRVKNISFLTVNRSSFGLNEQTPFTHRHIQTLGGLPLLPKWLSLNGEESYYGKKWRELFLGPVVNIGGLTKRKFLRDFYVFPHWDGAKGNFDVRLGYLHSFAH